MLVVSITVPSVEVVMVFIGVCSTSASTINGFMMCLQFRREYSIIYGGGGGGHHLVLIAVSP